VLAKVALIEDGSASLGGYARELTAAAVERGFLKTGAPPDAGAAIAGPPAG
jgi:hypothetical protein